jgi:hypothetical protein
MTDLATAERRRSGEPDIDTVREEMQRLGETEEMDAVEPPEPDETEHEESDGE